MKEDLKKMKKHMFLNEKYYKVTNSSEINL